MPKADEKRDKARAALRKRYLRKKKAAAPCPLDKMPSKNTALLLAQLLHVEAFESVVQQTQQRPEATLDPTVRSSREQQNVS